ncbi:hypothetical protein GW17_00046101 [Ensete ventricosum]|nr:hypothetical protein GW17_00046101 [Ensete ventricosum]
MGSCWSYFRQESHPAEKRSYQSQPQHRRLSLSLNQAAPEGGGRNVPPFAQFSFPELKAATDGFSPQNIVSESGDKAPNVIYKGRLQNRRRIVVKKFTRTAWPDPKQFAYDVIVLVYGSTVIYRFVWTGENQSIEWAMRLRIAFCIAEALEYCSNEGWPLYHDLNAYRVLFDEVTYLLLKEPFFM